MRQFAQQLLSTELTVCQERLSSQSQIQQLQRQLHECKLLHQSSVEQHSRSSKEHLQEIGLISDLRKQIEENNNLRAQHQLYSCYHHQMFVGWYVRFANTINSTVASKQNVRRICCVVHPSIKHFFYRPVLLQKNKKDEKKAIIMARCCYKALCFYKRKGVVLIFICTAVTWHFQSGTRAICRGFGVCEVGVDAKCRK